MQLRVLATKLSPIVEVIAPVVEVEEESVFDAAREESGQSQEAMAERRKLIEKRKEDNEMRIQYLQEEVGLPAAASVRLESCVVP